MYPVLLFDMDGTLVDSAEGVYQSMRYAMEAEGVPPIKREQARYFLGETLESVLKRKFGMEGPVVQRIRERFLPHYQETGLFATTPVPGMVELTRAFHEKGYRLGIASCKPWIYCGPTLQHCGFSDCFEAIAGSWHNGVPEEKTAVIREALRLLDVPAGQAVMIGDRGVDISCAASLGIPGIGLSYCGYGEPGELEQAGAVAVAPTAEVLGRIIEEQAWAHSDK